MGNYSRGTRMHFTAHASSYALLDSMPNDPKYDVTWSL
eukprot:SAG11_NODE_8802_length_974_cov_3.410286_1_plen_37_part_10